MLTCLLFLEEYDSDNPYEQCEFLRRPHTEGLRKEHQRLATLKVLNIIARIPVLQAAVAQLRIDDPNSQDAQGMYYVGLGPLGLGQNKDPERIIKLAEMAAKIRRKCNIVLGVAEGVWKELIDVIGETGAAQRALDRGMLKEAMVDSRAQEVKGWVCKLCAVFNARKDDGKLPLNCEKCLMSREHCNLADHFIKEHKTRKQFAPPTVPQVRKRTPEEKAQQREEEQKLFRSFGQEPAEGEWWWKCRNPKCPHLLKQIEAAEKAKAATEEPKEKKKKGKKGKKARTDEADPPSEVPLAADRAESSAPAPAAPSARRVSPLQLLCPVCFGAMPMRAQALGREELDAHNKDEEVSFETCVVLRQKTYLMLVWEQEQAWEDFGDEMNLDSDTQLAKGMAEDMARYGCADPEVLEELKDSNGKMPIKPPLAFLVKRQAILAIDVQKSVLESFSGILLRYRVKKDLIKAAIDEERRSTIQKATPTTTRQWRRPSQAFVSTKWKSWRQNASSSRTWSITRIQHLLRRPRRRQRPRLRRLPRFPSCRRMPRPNMRLSQVTRQRHPWDSGPWKPILLRWMWKNRTFSQVRKRCFAECLRGRP